MHSHTFQALDRIDVIDINVNIRAATTVDELKAALLDLTDMLTDHRSTDEAGDDD